MQPVGSTSSSLLEETTFTFKPKVSAKSTKIAESLGTNFMIRQQQHLEKQRQFAIGMDPQQETAAAVPQRVCSAGAQASRVSTGAGAAMVADRCTPDIHCTTPEGASVPTEVMPTMIFKPHPPSKAKSTTQLTAILEGGLGRKSPTILRRTKTRLALRKMSKSDTLPDASNITDMVDTDEQFNVASSLQLSHSRSKTMPPGSMTSHSIASKKLATLNLDRVRNAKLFAERALKGRKIFTIQGPYSSVRESLRKRGWVEKFYKMHMQPPPKKSPRMKKKRQLQVIEPESDDSDDDDDDDTDNDDPDDHGEKVPPWEEDNGFYGIMSRVARNSTPTFIWSVRRDVVDPKSLKRDQIINHYGRAGSFTTKVGLCVHMRNVHWFEEANADMFFPRCYRLSHDEDKQAFIDDYRLTACINLLKWLKQDRPGTARDDGSNSPTSQARRCTNPACTKSRPNVPCGNKCVHTMLKSASKSTIATVSTSSMTAEEIPVVSDTISNCGSLTNRQRKKKGGTVPMQAVDIALAQCERFICFVSHDDLDTLEDDHQLTDEEWNEFLQWYYRIIHEGATINNTSSCLGNIEIMLHRLKEKWPQYELDGTQNVWIVKPGAKSRGRGITCYDRLEDMLKLVSSVVKKEGKYVVQKYMERPLLIYQTKFDIRQWFLVTDWNPLTLWFYKDSYLRFCSQEYTLENFDQAIHLSNNAIQKNLENGRRSSKLPDENMWTCQKFQEYLSERGAENIWDDVIYPGMKKAITCALLCSQDFIEYRKNAFELYGADFMLTEDLRPWLIEINCSPSMSASTKITSNLCHNVLEDTVKVVLDRKYDKNCDTGRFELAYKQPQVTVPPYIGINLSVDGQAVRRPAWMLRKPSEATDSTTKIGGTAVTCSPYTAKSTTTSTNREKTVTGSNSKTNVGKVTSSSKCASNQDSGIRQSPPKPQRTVLLGARGQVTVALSKSPSLLANGRLYKRNMRDSNNNTLKTSTSDADMTDDIKNHQLLQSDDDDDDSSISSEQNNPVSGSVVSEISNIPDATLSDSEKAPSDKSIPIAKDKSKEITSTRSKTDVVLAFRRRRRSPTKLHPARSSKSLETQEEKIAVARTESSTGSISSMATTQSRTKQQLPMNSAEGVDIQHIQTQPPKGEVTTLIDTTWNRTCARCGYGLNLKLDPNVFKPCRCQQDGIKMDPMGNGKAAASGRHSPLPPAPPTDFSSLNSEDFKSLSPPLTNIPKRIHIDRNKLVASIYSKSQASNASLRGENRFVLRYTDAGIQKPATSSKIAQTGTFPKLVSKYISKNAGKDGLPVCLETYRQNPKLSIVTQSFS